MRSNKSLLIIMHNLKSCRSSTLGFTVQNRSYVSKISSWFKSGSAKDADKQPPEEPVHVEVNTHNIDKMNNQFRLEPSDYRKLHRLVPELAEEEKVVMDLKGYRKLYGEYGKAAGINVAALWPSKKEMDLQREYEQVAFPHTIREMLELENQMKLQEAEEIRAKQESIKKNLEKLDDWKVRVREKMAQQEQVAREYSAQKKKQIEEVRRILGYNIDTKDEKFAETVELLEEEERKISKKEKKLQKKQKLIDDLRAIAEKEAKVYGESIIEGAQVPPIPTQGAQSPSPSTDTPQGAQSPSPSTDTPQGAQHPAPPSTDIPQDGR